MPEDIFGITEPTPFGRLAAAAELIGPLFRDTILPEQERHLLSEARNNILAVMGMIEARAKRRVA